MGQQFKQRSLELPFPSHFLELIWDNTEVFQGKPKDVISPASPESDLRPPPGMTCPEHLTHDEMFWAFLLTGGILVRCLKHGNWFLWTWKSSISTLDPRSVKLLNSSPYLRKMPVLRKFIFDTCIYDFILSVTTHIL